MGQIVLGTKLVGSDRIRPVSRVGLGSVLRVRVPTQTRSEISGRVGPDPIGRGLS